LGLWLQNSLNTETADGMRVLSPMDYCGNSGIRPECAGKPMQKRISLFCLKALLAIQINEYLEFETLILGETNKQP
jgi:hypothetical protein